MLQLRIAFFKFISTVKNGIVVPPFCSCCVVPVSIYVYLDKLKAVYNKTHVLFFLFDFNLHLDGLLVNTGMLFRLSLEYLALPRGNFSR